MSNVLALDRPLWALGPLFGKVHCHHTSAAGGLALDRHRLKLGAGEHRPMHDHREGPSMSQPSDQAKDPMLLLAPTISHSAPTWRS